MKPTQNPFVYSRGTRSDESYVTDGILLKSSLVDEKLLKRKEQRRDKHRSGQIKRKGEIQVRKNERRHCCVEGGEEKLM